MSSSIPQSVQSKVQPWKEFFAAGDASALAAALYGNSDYVGGIERRWMQEEECNISSNPAARSANSSHSLDDPAQSSSIATSGANFSHSLLCPIGED